MRNPFRTAEKIGSVAGWTLLALVFLGSLSLVVAVLIREWGWWALLLIPGVPIGLFAILICGGLLDACTGALQESWRRAKWRWDERHRP